MRRVTIKDIAKIAGVSYSTVSRALSGSTEVSEETRSRILDICQKNGYRVNVLARSLICNKTNTLGLIVPEVTNPFYAELSLGIEIHSRSQGYNVILCNSLQDDATTEKLFEHLIGLQVDGIILASSHDEASHWVKKYGKTVPTVLLGGSIAEEESDGINSVCVDNITGGRIAAEYLLSLGHKDIMYMGLRQTSITHQLRFKGFSATLKAAGLQPKVIENTEPSSSIDNGYALGKRQFAQSFTSTAVFAATDSLALGILQAADEFGLQVPDDFSLLGFDNIVYSALPKIKLSTIDQRKQRLSEAAVNLLVDTIDSPQRDEYTRRLIRPKLILRQSCQSLPNVL
ncbi:MAG: LacI family DNA-binding transcriptional regulator [Lachnospiraceae bacterium]